MKKNRKNTIFVIIFTILLYAIIKELKIKEIKEPNHPELIDGMIQITYQNNNWVKADKTNKDDKYQWYDYNNQIWANVALVKAETRTKYLDAKIDFQADKNFILSYKALCYYSIAKNLGIKTFTGLNEGKFECEDS